MALSLPSVDEERDIISALCHARSPDARHFQAFLRFYALTVCPGPQPGHAIQITPPTLCSHQAILEACNRLQISPGSTKGEIESQLFPNVTEAAERHRCLRAVTKLAFMIDCDSLSNFSVNYKRQNEDTFPIRWRDGQTLIEFFHSSFPVDDTTSPLRTSDIGKRLKVWKLRKRYNIRIEPTNDLAQHLVYNTTTRTLSVFHQVAYLKAHLQSLSDLRISAAASESIPRYVASLSCQ
jgi:hypothetical protein